MAKVKKPLISLGAKGTIGDALTFQKHNSSTIVREKPIPKDPYSLNQAYQRWDYRDYAYLWTLLSNTEKQVYRTKASRYHITGFSQFMRENLKDLTNLVGRWHLDAKEGGIAYDSSKNTNNGTVIGTTLSPGRIDNSLYFDGVNDEVILGTSPILTLATNFWVEVFINIKTWVNNGGIVTKRLINTPGDWVFRLQTVQGELALGMYNSVGAWWSRASTDANLALDTWYQVDMFTDSTKVLMWRNGVPLTVPANWTALTPQVSPLKIGRGFVAYIDAYIDEVRYADREPTTAEILIHAQRRYPRQ